jgi:archaellum component FlaC
MIYGHTFLREATTSRSNRSLDELYSVAWSEYNNKKRLMESCSDYTQRSLLEAQVDVLREVSLKDIGNKIKEIFQKIINWIKSVIDKVVGLFTKEKKAKALSAKEKIKKNGISEEKKASAAGKPVFYFQLDNYCDISKFSNFASDIDQTGTIALDYFGKMTGEDIKKLDNDSLKAKKEIYTFLSKVPDSVGVLYFLVTDEYDSEVEEIAKSIDVICSEVLPVSFEFMKKAGALAQTSDKSVDIIASRIESIVPVIFKAIRDDMEQRSKKESVGDLVAAINTIDNDISIMDKCTASLNSIKDKVEKLGATLTKLTSTEDNISAADMKKLNGLIKAVQTGVNLDLKIVAFYTRLSNEKMNAIISLAGE